MKGEFLFLGTGASAGVPVIGCKCAVCTSPSKKNQRLRPSGLLKIGGKKILIDIGPDFRSQAIAFGIDSIDGLLLTHTHYDHIAGIDEVRIFNVRQKRALPCLLSQESFEELKKRYYYFFKEGEWCAKLDVEILKEPMGEVEFLGLPIRYCTFFQKAMQVTGFRLGRFAYISDIQSYEESIFPFLEGVELLVLSALRQEKSTFHLSFDEAVAFARRAGAKETWLTHVGHFLDHDAINALLPPEVRMAYDGLKVEIFDA